MFTLAFYVQVLIFALFLTGSFVKKAYAYRNYQNSYQRTQPTHVHTPNRFNYVDNPGRFSEKKSKRKCVSFGHARCLKLKSESRFESRYKNNLRRPVVPIRLRHRPEYQHKYEQNF